jgi:hypothetical protein
MKNILRILTMMRTLVLHQKTKTVVAVAFMLVASITVSNAQYFVESRIAVQYRKNDGVKAPTNDPMSNYITPSTSMVFSTLNGFGYQVNEKYAVGVQVGYQISKNTSKYQYVWADSAMIQTKDDFYRLHIGTFGRRQIVNFKKFSIFAEGSCGFGFGKRIVWADPDRQGTNGTASISSFRIDILPLFVYEVSEKITIKLANPFLHLSFQTENTTYKDGTNNRDSRLGVDSRTTIQQSILNSEIGIIYKF